MIREIETELSELYATLCALGAAAYKLLVSSLKFILNSKDVEIVDIKGFKHENSLALRAAILLRVVVFSCEPSLERNSTKKDTFSLSQYFQFYWRHSEDAFNELTYYQEWLLEKGLPPWKVHTIYFWRKSRTYIQLLKSMVLGSARQLFRRESI